MQWRTREEKSSSRPERKQRLPPLGAEILDIMRFVEDHVVPSASLEYLLVLQDQLIRGDEYVPTRVVHPAFSFLSPFLLVPVVGHDLETRTPLFKLHLPVEDDTCRDDDQMRAPDLIFQRQVCK